MAEGGSGEGAELNRAGSQGGSFTADLIPRLSLSQSTLDAILGEVGSMVTCVEEESLNFPVSSSQVVPEEYSAEISDVDAIRYTTVPHSFRIEQQSYNVIPEPAAFVEQHTLHTPQLSQICPTQPATGAAFFQLPPTAVKTDPLPAMSTPKPAESVAQVGENSGQVAVEAPPVALASQPTVALEKAPSAYRVRPLTVAQQGQTRRPRNQRMEEVKMKLDEANPKGRQSPAVPAAAAISDFPSNTPYPGPYQFEIFFTKAQEAESKKTISYIYSDEEQKLYVRMKVHCPVHFKTGRPPPDGSRIRAMVIYSRPQDVGEVVKRCMNHIVEDKDLPHREHLVRCHNPVGVDYEETGWSKRHSVSIPWDSPAPGTEFITGIYEFTCFSSCSGTINRRPTQMIFTLENNGEVLGRQVIELRICACPGRDIILSEGGGPSNQPNLKRRTPHPPGIEEKIHAFTHVEPVSKSKKQRDNEIYTIQVRGRELYKIVMTIIKNYEISRRYEELAPIFRQMQGLQAALPDGGAANGYSQGSQVQSTRLKALLPEQMQPDTSVYDWLISLELSNYAPSFTEIGLYTLEDLEGVLSLEMLNRLGMSEEDRDRLFGAYIQWKSVQQSQALSSLSTLSSQDSLFSSLPSASQNGANSSPEGYRVSKTRVVTTYKVPKKRGNAGRSHDLS